MFAIVLEVIGTTFLQKSEQFTRLWPSIIVLISYFSAFYFLSISLRTIPVGIAYGIWSGVGIVLISCIGYFIFKQKLDLAAMIGLGLIIAGVIVVNIFSKTIMH
jgi:small multidrug resistance pump